MGWRSIWRNNEWVRETLAMVIERVWAEGVKAVQSVRAEL
jgi:hypothetical protein